MMILLVSLAASCMSVQEAVKASEEPVPSPGYDKVLLVDGVRIESTDRVPNDWLYFSALVLDGMIDHETRYDIPDRLRSNGFRILLAGPDQPLNELPEYIDDDAAVHAGGLGGNPGEYRIALRTTHPHVLVHELAHGIYHTAIQYEELDGSTDPEDGEKPPVPGTFTHDLHQAYEVAMKAGTWKGLYFEAHPDEYWAEGVTLWFGVPEQNLEAEFDPRLEPKERELLRRDPRGFLQQRDPALHELASRIFPDSAFRPMNVQVLGIDRMEFQQPGGGLEELVRELDQIAENDPGEACDVLEEIAREIADEEGVLTASMVMMELAGRFDSRRLNETARRLSRRFDRQPRPARLPGGRPDLEIRPIPGSGPLSVFTPTFTRYMDIFGVLIVATPGTPDAKVLHAGNILAQWMDNDEDGTVDDPNVHLNLIREGAFLVMTETEREMNRIESRRGPIEAAGFHVGQALFAEETLPGNPPHVDERGRFDATIEEVLHLVSNGWRDAYPEDFGYEPGSRLADAMDKARGGRFQRVPRRYPEQAWYHYDDRSCDYECMVAEYFYWSLTSLLGGQNYPGRAREISDEWECPTPELLERTDPDVHELLTGQHRLPRVLPDGTYGHDPKP